MVLLLDDDRDFRSALAANLADDGIAVREYAHPHEVPPLGSFERLSMLIIDYQLRGEDGLTFADRFHAVHPEVPVVMVTAYWTAHLEAEAARRGYLTLRRKPIDYDEIARLLPTGS
jgi:DNA-binding NtrC family response regulator